VRRKILHRDGKLARFRGQVNRNAFLLGCGEYAHGKPEGGPCTLRSVWPRRCRRRHTGSGRADAADGVLTAREAPGEPEDQNGGQSGEGADAGMREGEAGGAGKQKRTESSS